MEKNLKLNGRYFKQLTNTVFYDPHGDDDDGGTKITVYNGETDLKEIFNVEDIEFILDNLGETLTDNWGEGLILESEIDEDNLRAEDGYNCEKEFYKFIEISKEEFEKNKKIIESYNELIKSF